MLYGGFNENWDHYNDTWGYDYSQNTWINRNPGTAPPGTGGHCLSYDWDTRQLILFGGHLAGGGASLETLHQTWAYDYDANTWTNRTTSTHPSGRCWADMVYDVQAERQILFGGLEDNANAAQDTWAYDYDTNTWTLRNPATSPAARFDHRMVYDQESDKVILVGGVSGAGAIRSDVWAYDYTSNTWTQRTAFHRPIASHALSYDSNMDRVVLFGGGHNFAETDVSDQTWTYDYNTDTWTQLLPTPHPPLLIRTDMAYDHSAQRNILFGGRGPSPDPILFEDTWALYLFDLPPFPWLIIIAVIAVIFIIIILIICLWRRRQ
jgi:N-acetylneuraminic acid mutarotase